MREHFLQQSILLTEWRKGAQLSLSLLLSQSQLSLLRSRCTAICRYRAENPSWAQESRGHDSQTNTAALQSSKAGVLYSETTGEILRAHRSSWLWRWKRGREKNDVEEGESIRLQKKAWMHVSLMSFLQTGIVFFLIRKFWSMPHLPWLLISWRSQ